MTTRNSQSGEKKQTSAKDTREPKPRIGVKEEPDIKSRRRRTQPADHQKQSRVTCDPKPRTRQQEKLSARRRVEGLMKHVPDEEKQPGSGPQDPRKKNSQGWDSRTHERKSSANSRQK